MIQYVCRIVRVFVKESQQMPRIPWVAGLLTLIALATLMSPARSQVSIVDVTDPELDMDRQLQAYRAAVSPLVELGPQHVVGQGEDSNNYTLIKCLNEYEVPYLQFLAYPTTVTGGVSVNAGELFPDSGLEIVATPLTSTVVPTIRIFTNMGLLKYEFQPASMTAARRSRVASSISSGRGQPRPASRNLMPYSLTVAHETLVSVQ